MRHTIQNDGVFFYGVSLDYYGVEAWNMSFQNHNLAQGLICRKRLL